MLNEINKNDIDGVSFYLNKAGANVNGYFDKTTPLIKAVENNYFNIVKFLLEKGAYPYYKSLVSFEEPIDIARRKGNSNIVSLLKQYHERFYILYNGHEMVKVKGLKWGTYFYISRYPITVKQYMIFCERTGRAMPTPPSWGWLEDHPIFHVNWYDCKEYCKWCKTRLPTEIEWFYAAGGQGYASPFDYSGSNNIDEIAWYDRNSGGKTHPVGKKNPNESGIFDMSGNVFEWCDDWFMPGHFNEIKKNYPNGPQEGEYKVIKGGCYNYGQTYCWVKWRNGLLPTCNKYTPPPILSTKSYGDHDVGYEEYCFGFRVVVDDINNNDDIGENCDNNDYMLD